MEVESGVKACSHQECNKKIKINGERSIHAVNLHNIFDNKKMTPI